MRLRIHPSGDSTDHWLPANGGAQCRGEERFGRGWNRTLYRSAKDLDHKEWMELVKPS